VLCLSYFTIAFSHEVLSAILSQPTFVFREHKCVHGSESLSVKCFINVNHLTMVSYDTIQKIKKLKLLFPSQIINFLKNI